MFIKCLGQHRPTRHQGTTEYITRYIAVSWIEEISVGEPVYVKDKNGKEVLVKGEKVVQYETTDLWVAGSDRLGNEESHFVVRGALPDVVARISSAIEARRGCCDPAVDEDDEDES